MQTTNLFAKTTTKTSTPKKADKKVLPALNLGDKVKGMLTSKTRLMPLQGN
jgi:hypothetical protein